ncbi:MAG: hypothetical protein V4622_06690 [Bacteroidota bacterium]
MKHELTIIFLFVIIFSCTRSNNDTIKSKDSKTEIISPPVFNPKHYDKIGFACGEGGVETTLINEFTKLIKDKKYQQLKARLYSSKPGEVYLSTISTEKLAKEGMIKLNIIELRQIEKNRNKTDTIYTCSGCTESGYYTVKQLLNDTTNFTRKEAGWWFDKILGKNIIE